MSGIAKKQPASAKRSGALSGHMRVPGDKSISHRALILAACATGTSRVSGLLEGDDVLATANAMRAMGAEIDRIENGDWQITGVGPMGLKSPSAPLDFGNAGTGARLVMGLVAGAGGGSAPRKEGKEGGWGRRLVQPTVPQLDISIPHRWRYSGGKWPAPKP